MMNNPTDEESVTINILNRNFQAVCSPEKAPELMRAANYLDKKAREIKQTGKSLDYDKIIVMAALNLSYELLYDRPFGKKYIEEVNSRLNILQNKVNSALQKEDKEALFEV